MSARRFGLIVTIVTAGLLAVPALIGLSSAGANEVEVTVTKVGWWSDRIGANEVGEGGFEVSVSPTGELEGIAAFELSIDAGAVDNAEIVLTELAALAEFSSLTLCPTTEAWEPADPGALDDAPTPDCSQGVALTRTIDTMVWLGNITSLVRDGGTVALMVVPEHNPPTPVSAGMLVRVQQIDVRAEGSAASATTTSTTLDFTTPGGANTFDPEPDSGLAVDFGTPTIDPIDLPPNEPALDDLGSQPADTETPADTATEDDGFFALEPVDVESEPPKPWIRLLLIVPLSAAIGIGSAWGRRWLESRSQVAVT